MDRSSMVVLQAEQSYLICWRYWKELVKAIDLSIFLGVVPRRPDMAKAHRSLNKTTSHFFAYGYAQSGPRTIIFPFPRNKIRIWSLTLSKIVPEATSIS
uniref:Uncharacterized protein n=1 Tax=Physcomitrium patens TaxID=3218 RepID=A0A7I4F741_PHYPA